MSHMTSISATLLWEPHITHELNFQCSKEHHVPFIRDWCEQCTYYSDVDSGSLQNNRSPSLLVWLPKKTTLHIGKHTRARSFKICYSLSVCICHSVHITSRLDQLHNFSHVVMKTSYCITPVRSQTKTSHFVVQVWFKGTIPILSL